MSDQPSPSQPSEDVLEIGAPEQFAALAHPLRQRLLFALGHRPAAANALAAQLGAKKGTVAHHLKVLREAGLVRVAETRPVRGGTELYYQRTARRMLVTEPRAEGTAAMFAAVAQELDLSPVEHVLSLRHLRLSPAKARELGETLARLVDEAEDEDEDEAAAEAEASAQEEVEGRPVHGVLVALYQQPSAADPSDPA
ncbi:helix-turn-helix domain-containing protein [Streptomyces sp. NPDC087440]|uniref:helix-turn-helix domain-containing protein n=1 Tax=Streptomyces sp. NPDC087440 TaxID=3365790 RepID=UPI003829AAC4